MRKSGLLACAALAGVGVLGAAVVGANLTSRAWAEAAPSAKSVTVATHRLTESQYRHAIADIFGPKVELNARFEPERRDDGLQAVGNADLSVTSSGFEQYFNMARSISNQVLGEDMRAQSLGCAPADAEKPDDACARQFIEKYGPQLFRRPLTEGEIAERVETAHKGAEASGDFYSGLKLALSSLLVAPDFLFRVDNAEADPDHKGQLRLDPYSKAQRISFLLWDTTPDAELTAAAASGDLNTEAGLKRQVDRLLASPRVRDGARAFFTDMLQFENFDGLVKDPNAYPKFSQAVADSAREQTLKTMVYLLVDRDGDYRDIFTSNETFINRALAGVYKVPYASADEWTKYTFPKTSERSGVLTQITFLSLFSHPAASSPTKRGVKVNEIFLCQPTPDPPPNVDFSKVQALDHGTVRTRLLAHMQNEGCASCHQNSDPVGLTLEHFDGLGQLRTLENGQLIDVSGDLHGNEITGAQGLGQFLHDNPQAPACLTRNVIAYGLGRSLEYSDEVFANQMVKTFAADGYKYKSLLEDVASSPEFYRVAVPDGAASPVPTTVAEASITRVPGGNR